MRFPLIEDGDGGAEVFYSTHLFTFCFRGDTAEMQQRIADIFRRFGCPIYDPQFDVLYPLDQPPAKVTLKDILEPFRPKTEEVAKCVDMEIAAVLERAERKKREDNRAWYEPVEKLGSQIACVNARGGGGSVSGSMQKSTPGCCTTLASPTSTQT